MPPVPEEHRASSPRSVRCFVLTVSDSRTPETDSGGDALVQGLEGAGHEVVGREIVRDEPGRVQEIIRAHLGHAQVIVTTGGTGLTSRDTTCEAIAALFDKRIDGFGELFRSLSYAEIGAAAMMSRACGGTIGRTAVFALPGSPAAVRLALEKLILPEIGHIARELAR